MGHYYRFKRGDPVTITSGRYKGSHGVVDSAVFQHTVDYPEEYAAGYHVILDTGPGLITKCLLAGAGIHGYLDAFPDSNDPCHVSREATSTVHHAGHHLSRNAP